MGQSSVATIFATTVISADHKRDVTQYFNPTAGALPSLKRRGAA